jgi:hypothetical protein
MLMCGDDWRRLETTGDENDTRRERQEDRING